MTLNSGIALRLKEIKTFLCLFGNPQAMDCLVIHIAGTNGKGSTLAFLESLLGQLPLSIGKYTSPHLVSVHERFTLNGQAISAENFQSLWAELAAQSSFFALTYFEQLTALAFVYFQRAGVDILLLETGLGGRLDATNVIDKPALTLICSISIDHCEYLGESIEAIAFEKAGILKEQVPFITTALEPALGVIRTRALTIGSPELALLDLPIEASSLGLAGSFQVENARLASSAFAFLLARYFPQHSHLASLEPLSAGVSWPGRYELVQELGFSFILDGAHNVGAIQALRAELDRESLSKARSNPRLFLLGILARKDWQSMLKILLRPEDNVIFCAPDDCEEAVLEQDLRDFLARESPFSQISWVYCASRAEAWELFASKLKASSEESKEIEGIVCGSLYLVGWVKAITGLSL